MRKTRQPWLQKTTLLTNVAKLLNVRQLVQALEVTKGFQLKDFLKPVNQDSYDILGDTERASSQTRT